MATLIHLKKAFYGLVLCSGLFLAACDQSAADIMSKATNVKSTKQLIDAIGRPDRVEKKGALDHWYYKTSDGMVEFKVQGGKVTMGRVTTR